jgi:ribosomal protein L3 glutamine methyltransferase
LIAGLCLVLSSLLTTMTNAADLLSVMREAASLLRQSGVLIGHHHDNALDEARELVLHALQLPHDFPANLATGMLSADERTRALKLVQRRINERIPAAYLTGIARFAGLAFRTDARALVPRSPIAELIENGFASWFGSNSPAEILDLCTGSGCIGIAAALRFPNAHVMLADLSETALTLAQENIELHNVSQRVRTAQSDLFDAIHGRFDLILSNPPYITDGEYAQMAPEYRHEPKLGLTSGHDGLDHPLQILRQAANFLSPRGLLILEVGEAERALKKLLPTLPARWIEFSVGQMGVLAISRAALLSVSAPIEAVCVARLKK